ncbi:hypothetical protein MFFC18_47000 [Mariniblastus fucicola]|uniref:Chromosome partition protein Smc n=1 Tax=Mariniblastus fucicola TaxID=980251 RepID=A0A5B9PDL8_9BACT|nr:hypothetical protein MFFC18_47000 [Mariniblastus fucicola]
MMQTSAIGILILTAVLINGCESESEKMANMAERVAHSQNEINTNLAKANNTIVELNREIQQERNGLQNERLKLNGQFENLEQDRRDLHRQRRSELAWSESFRFLAIAFAAVMPLFLCAYLIWVANQRSVEQDEINTILLQELASPNPRLIIAPNSTAIEDCSKEETAPTKTKRRKKLVSHREN